MSMMRKLVCIIAFNTHTLKQEQVIFHCIQHEYTRKENKNKSYSAVSNVILRRMNYHPKIEEKCRQHWITVLDWAWLANHITWIVLGVVTAGGGGGGVASSSLEASQILHCSLKLVCQTFGLFF